MRDSVAHGSRPDEEPLISKGMSETYRFDRRAAVVVLLLTASTGVLAAAYFFQHVLGYEPCKLCLYQRVPWWIVGGLASLMILFRRQHLPIGGLLAIAALALAANAGVAGYHVGVEQKWWPGPASCSASVASGTSFEDLKAQLLAAPIVRCDEVQWSLFGVSMAGYNVLLSAGFAALTMLVLIGTRQGRPA